MLRPYIIEGGFALAKTQVHQAISRIIDEHQQAIFIAASFKLIMMRAIDLDELTDDSEVDKHEACVVNVAPKDHRQSFIDEGVQAMH